MEADQHPLDRGLPVDLVRVDSIYNPVRRANFSVAETRVGQRTDYDRLTLIVETNGTISPEEAVSYAAALAQTHFQYFVEFGTHASAPLGLAFYTLDRARRRLRRLLRTAGGDDLGHRRAGASDRRAGCAMLCAAAWRRPLSDDLRAPDRAAARRQRRRRPRIHAAVHRRARDVRPPPSRVVVVDAQAMEGKRGDF